MKQREEALGENDDKDRYEKGKDKDKIGQKEINTARTSLESQNKGTNTTQNTSDK